MNEVLVRVSKIFSALARVNGKANDWNGKKGKLRNQSAKENVYARGYE